MIVKLILGASVGFQQSYESLELQSYESLQLSEEIL
ncbi:hypothetical protein LINPERPRIM_LOCUS5745 [Linum perenne]